MMNKKLLNLLVIAVLVISCADETTVFVDSDDALTLENDAAVLRNSVDFSESGVLDIYDENANKLSGKFAISNADSYPMALVAKIDPPQSATAQELAATHIDMSGNFIYISYNTAGEVYSGAVDVVDITDFGNPQLTSRLYYENVDLNAIAYDNGFVYVVGGIDAEQSLTATANSFVAKIPVMNGVLDVSGEITTGYQEGFVGNDLVVNSNGVFVSSGVNGYITQYDKNTLKTIKELPYTDLRSIVEKDGQFAVLDAAFGIRILDADLNEVGGIGISGSDFRLADKRTISWFGDRISVAEGNKGAGIYNAQTGEMLDYVPILTNPSNTDAADVVTNAVAFNEDVFLMANGGGGLALSENEQDLNLVGVIELNGSINYVASKEDYIFAASGRSGLQIIKMNRPPNSLQEACIGAPLYVLSSTLSVAPDEVLSYSGSKNFRSLEVGGELLLCGTWASRDSFNVLNDALLEIRGIVLHGRNNRRSNIVVGAGSTMRVEGIFMLYGDLILEEGARLEFIGPTNTAYLFGNLQKAESAVITGNFTDVMNAF